MNNLEYSGKTNREIIYDAARFLAKYEVCWTVAGCGSIGISSVTLLTNESPLVECEEPCQDLCNEWLIDDPLTLPKIGYFEEKPDNEQDTKSFIKPNPNNGKIALNIEGGFRGNLQISIHDIEGRLIYTEKVNKENYQIEIPVDLSNYAAGKYFYKILTNNAVISQGSFNIAK